MVLPTAATLQGIRICLESIEAGGPVQYPEDVPASDKANYKNKCKTQFELVSLSVRSSQTWPKRDR